MAIHKLFINLTAQDANKIETNNTGTGNNSTISDESLMIEYFNNSPEITGSTYINDSEIEEMINIQLQEQQDNLSFNDNFDYIEEAPKKEETTNDNNNIGTQSVETQALKSMEATIAQKRAEIEAKKDSINGLGTLWNGVKGVFGGGTKGELKEIEELEKMYAEVEANPTQANIEKLYKQINGTDINWNELNDAVNTSQELAKGTFVSETGEIVTQEDVTNLIVTMVEGLDESFNEGVQSQGWLSKGLGWLNNNIIGLGQTQNMTQAQIDELKEAAQKLTQTTDPEEYAALYKQITGEELSAQSVNELVQGQSKVENTTAAEAMMDYEATQETAVTAFNGVVIGLATATMGPLGGFLVGGAINVGLKGLDAATQSNGKSVGENLLDYAKDGLIKDFLVGGVAGFANVKGNAASKSFLAKYAKDGTSWLVKTGVRLGSEFAEGAVDGGISSGGEYLADVITGDKEFNLKEFVSTTALGAGMGGVFSVGMQEGMAVLGAGAKALLNKGDVPTIKNTAKGFENVEIKEGLDPTHEYGRSIIDKNSGEMYTWDKTENKWIRDLEGENSLRRLEAQNNSNGTSSSSSEIQGEVDSHTTTQSFEPEGADNTQYTPNENPGGEIDYENYPITQEIIETEGEPVYRDAQYPEEYDGWEPIPYGGDEYPQITIEADGYPKTQEIPHNELGIKNFDSPNAQRALELGMPKEQTEIIIDLLDNSDFKNTFNWKDFINTKWDLAETQDFAKYINEGMDLYDAKIKATRPWDLDSMAIYKNKIDTMSLKGNQYEKELAKFLDIDNMPTSVKEQLLNSGLTAQDAIESIEKLSTSTYRNAMRKPNLYLNDIDPKFTLKQADGHYPKVTGDDLKIQQEAMNKFFQEHIVEMQIALKYTDTDTLNAMMAKRTNQFAQQLEKFNKLSSSDLELVSELIKGKSLDKGLGSLQADEKLAIVDLVYKYRRANLDMSGLKNMADAGEVSISGAKKAANDAVLRKAGLTEEQIANIPEELMFNQEYLYRAYDPKYQRSHGKYCPETFDTEPLYDIIRESSLGNFDKYIFDVNNKYGQANLKTKELFEEMGINYEKWLSPDTPAVEITVGGKKLTAKLWDRNPQQDLFLGDMTNCCTQVGSTNGAATPAYLMNTSFNVIKLYDEAGNVVAMSRVYCGDINGKPSLCLDNFEIDKSFVDNLSATEKDAITEAIFEYGKDFSKEIFGTSDPSAYITYCDLAHRINDDFLDESTIWNNLEAKFIGYLSQKNIYINANHEAWINPLEQIIRNWKKIK